MKKTITQNFCAQTAPPFEKFFRALGNREVHPITRTAFLSPMETNALHFKILSDQTVEIDIARENVSTHNARGDPVHLQGAAKLVENFEREKGDLSLVISFEIEITIAPQSATGHAFDLRHLDHRKIVRLLSIMSDKVVSGRDVKMTDFHRPK